MAVKFHVTAEGKLIITTDTGETESILLNGDTCIIGTDSDKDLYITPDGTGKTIIKNLETSGEFPARTFTVAPTGGSFTNIKDAIAAALALPVPVSNTAPVTIMVANGLYVEDNSSIIVVPIGTTIQAMSDMVYFTRVQGSDSTKPIFEMQGEASIFGIAFIGGTSHLIEITDSYANILGKCMFIGGTDSVKVIATIAWNATLADVTFTGTTGTDILIDSTCGSGNLIMRDVYHYSYGGSGIGLDIQADGCSIVINNHAVYGPYTTCITMTGSSSITITVGTYTTSTDGIIFTPTAPSALSLNQVYISGNSTDMTLNGSASCTMVGGFIALAYCTGVVIGSNFNGSFFDGDSVVAKSTNSAILGYMRMEGGDGSYFLAPVMTTVNLPGSPEKGMIVFDDTLGQFVGYDGANWNILG